MSLPMWDLLAELGFVIAERRAPGRLELMGSAPAWWLTLAGDGVFDADEVDPGGALTFLVHFLDDAESAWAEGGAFRRRSGMWVEEAPAGPLYLEAEALTFSGRKLLLVRSLGDEGAQRETLLRAARARNLRQSEDDRAQGLLKVEMEKAKERAEALNTAKSTFLANMSHEIRTSMSGVIGLTELLLESEPRPDQVDYLRLAKESGEVLLALINDILDLSKIEAGKVVLDPGPFEIGRLLSHTLGTQSIRAQDKGIELSHSVGPGLTGVFSGDALRIRQVVLNLVGNAIKFTSRGEVRVEVTLIDEDEGVAKVHFSVQDTGGGIPEDRRQKIFEAFAQADASIVRTHGGTGLGLSISGQLVALMGGHLSLASEVGVGSDFHFTLPLPRAVGAIANAAPEASEAQAMRTTEVAPLHILLAEDNAVNQLLCKALLAKHGHTVVVVEDGEAALAALEGGRFDLVLMDVQMPKMDGLTATRTIRAGQATAGVRTPIIALTANAMKGDRDLCLEAGMDGYLSKPLRPHELYEAIASTFSTGNTQ